MSKPWELLKGHEALSAYATCWSAWSDELAPAERFPFPAMWEAWIECFASRPPWRGVPHLLVALDRGRPIAMLPLHPWGPRPAALFSHAGLWQPTRTVIGPSSSCLEAADATATGLERLPCAALLLGPMSDSRGLPGALWSALEARGFRRLVQQHTALAEVLLPASWDEYSRLQVHKSALSNAQYYTRKFERDSRNSVRFWLNPSGAEAEALFDHIGRVEERSWLGTARDGGCRFVHPHQKRYWRMVSEACPRYGCSLEAWTLHEDDKPVAFQLCLGAPGYRLKVATNYDEAYAKLRTGSILYLLAFRHFIDIGVREVSFGSGSLSYKSKWGAETRDWESSCLVFKPGLLGGLKAAGVRGALKLRELGAAGGRARHDADAGRE